MKRDEKKVAAEWTAKGIPNNDRIERASLAALLMGNVGTLNQTALTSFHYFSPAHQIIFGAIAEAEADGRAYDVVSIIQTIEAEGNLANAGGAAYVEGLIADPLHNNAVGMLPEYVEELEKVREARGVWKVIETGQTAMRTAGANPEEIAGEIKAGLDKVFTGGGVDESVTGKALEESVAHLERVKKRDKKQMGIWVGIPSYDRELGGLFPGCMDIIGARPAVGKTSMIETMIDTQLEQGHSVVIFQRDMSISAMFSRIACRRAKVVYEDYFRGEATNAELYRIKMELRRLQKLVAKIRTYNPAILTAAQLSTIVQRDKDRHGVRAWYLDHFQTLQHGTLNTVEGLTEASKRLRNLIHVTDVPGVIIAQISKEADKTARPHAGQFKYCDQLFSDADRIALLWSNDDPKTLEPNERQEVFFSVEKNRFGPPSDNKMNFHRELMTFEAIA